MMDWLNANSGALTVIATFVLVFVTGWYVHLTRELLKASYKPEVVVYLRASPTFILENLQVNETTLCVKNTGQGVARKIEFGDNLSFAPYGGEPLESIGFLKNGIDALAPGQERRQSEPSVADQSGDLSQLQVAIKVTYEDAHGKEYSDTFPLDFTEPDLLPTQGDP
ncbi:MAG: hypothetical protein OXN27_18390 [Candidatus Poribacteria bacterium]|nr:hypothetical protein [Candidatus Poribacteria bacterium]